jgi:hypothetical protein
VRWAVLSCLALPLLAAPCAAQDDEGPPEPPGRAPLVGRPADVPFSEASASFFKAGDGDFRMPFEVTPSITPKRVRAGEPLRYVVTIRALGKVHHPPARFDLRLVPAFDREFHIEDITEDKKERIDAATWRWAFLLKPRDSDVRTVPGLPFAYYNPDLQPPDKGFQVLWTDPTAIEVAEPERPPVPVSGAGFILRLAEGPTVLAGPRGWPAPGPWLIALTWAVPPALGAAWYFYWRGRYPDAARLARRRRSRAARRALRALNGADAAPPRRRGEQVAHAVASYLRERFDLSTEEPTPAEGRELLLARRLPGELAGCGADLLAGCDAARFGADEIANDLPQEARAFILAVEEQCPLSS